MTHIFLQNAKMIGKKMDIFRIRSLQLHYTMSSFLDDSGIIQTPINLTLNKWFQEKHHSDSE